MLKALRLTITGEPKLHCASCEGRVTRTLRRLDGVREVRADAGSQRVEVMLDTVRSNVEEVVAHLALLGYHAQPDTPASQALLPEGHD